MRRRTQSPDKRRLPAPTRLKALKRWRKDFSMIPCAAQRWLRLSSICAASANLRAASSGARLSHKGQGFGEITRPYKWLSCLPACLPACQCMGASRQDQFSRPSESERNAFAARTFSARKKPCVPPN
jgi:hypothetical protein